MVDLGKYQDKMKYGLFNWPVRFCTIGRKIPNPVERKETLVKEIHFDTLLRILKHTDWAKTPVYEQFKRSGRWTHDDDTIYSELEVTHLKSTLHNIVNADQYDEFNANEGEAIINKHWPKTLETLRKLMQ